MKIEVKVHLIISILAVVLIGSLMVIFQYSFFPRQVEVIEKRTWDAARYLQSISPHLSNSEKQELLMKLVKNERDFSYLLVLDKEGKAVAHSDPNRVGMVFKDPATLSGLYSKNGLQQTYVRDADNPKSPYHGEKVIDVMLPYYDQTGIWLGAVDVGLSFNKIDDAKRSFYLLLFLSAFVLAGVLVILDWSLFREIVYPLTAFALANKQIQESLRISEEKFALAFRASPEAISIATLEDGRYLEVNDTWESFYGYTREEAVGKTSAVLQVWITPEERDKIVDELQQNPIMQNVEKTMRVKNGELRPTLCSYTILEIDGEKCMLFVSIDLSLRKQLEEEMLKAGKLESLGVLAGGIAHDFNNLLTIIIGNLALAQMNLGEQSCRHEDITELLLEAEKASFQARGLTNQLLTFAKGGAPIKEPSAIKDLITDSAGFSLCGSNVICEFQFSQELLPVNIDAGQMGQVINNLIINAVQAMPQGGKIKIAAENIQLSGFEFPTLPAGEYVKISIQDQGIGIPAEDQKRIFDPYFTTKVTGNGLGLATSYSIIRKHDGHISLESQPGQGTCFYIYLPASSQETSEKRESPGSMPPGQGKILVMDDEERIRELARQILDSLGYQVEMARDGNEALEKYRIALEGVVPFDLVIIDLTIPGGMGGKQTMQKLLEIDPNVRVIVSSGYSNDPVMADYRQWGFRGVIAKPYGIRELSRIIGKVMNEQIKTNQ